MMIDITQFNALKATSAKSFNQQKALIKQLMSGKKVRCAHCQQELILTLPEAEGSPGIHCDKGCTEISLDFI